MASVVVVFATFSLFVLFFFFVFDPTEATSIIIFATSFPSFMCKNDLLTLVDFCPAFVLFYMILSLFVLIFRSKMSFLSCFRATKCPVFMTGQLQMRLGGLKFVFSKDKRKKYVSTKLCDCNLKGFYYYTIYVSVV